MNDGSVVTPFLTVRSLEFRQAVRPSRVRSMGLPSAAGGGVEVRARRRGHRLYALEVAAPQLVGICVKHDRYAESVGNSV